MSLIAQHTWVCECDACHAQTTITAPSYPRAGSFLAYFREI